MLHSASWLFSFVHVVVQELVFLYQLNLCDAAVCVCGGGGCADTHLVLLFRLAGSW
jgi:hypothetical protein